MERIYRSAIDQHLDEYNQMVILAGPRCVGKTTLCRDIVKSRKSTLTLSWDNIADRELILSGVENLSSQIKAKSPANEKAIIVLDELSFYREWKNLLKGYYDSLSKHCRFIVISNEKVNIYRSGQDSLMGRYFSYQIHPFSVAEVCQRKDISKEYTQPKKIADEDWNNLIQFGGFPETFLKSSKRYYNIWSKERRENFINTEVRDQARINNTQSFNLLIELIQKNVGTIINFSRMARAIQTSTPTVQHWSEVLCNLYYCFSVYPWSQDISRTLQKAPKFYFYDWSQIKDENIKIENFVACHLKKAVDFWNDIGLGEYQLYYVRDKDKYEVDFLVIKNGKPWIMIDVKCSQNLSRSILRFQEQLQVPHVFQLSYKSTYVDKDCFSENKPVIVPMKTILSQLV